MLIQLTSAEKSLCFQNKWWIPDVDHREPVWQSCRESGDKADLRYQPPSDVASLYPETTQLLEISDWKIDSNSDRSKEDLESSVLVLKRHQSEQWERYNVYGCARIRASNGWSAGAESRTTNLTGENRGTEYLVSFKQDSLFHPLLVRFKAPEQRTRNWKPAQSQIRKDSANNASLSSFFASSNNSTRKNVNTPTDAVVQPTFSLHRRNSSSNEFLDCRLGQGERLNLLSTDNSLRVESDQADDDTAAYSAYFTDAALESVTNNVLWQIISVRWPNKDNVDKCALIRPDRESTVFVQSSFYYPLSGAITFAQPKSRPEAATVIAGNFLITVNKFSKTAFLNFRRFASFIRR